MILVADGGATKTDWRIIDHNNKVISFQTKGMNPLFTTDDEIINGLKNSILPEHQQSIKEIYYYGAGLANTEIINKMTNVFAEFFPTSVSFNLYDDLTAAARALFGESDGIACILGTGSNSCMVKNGEIVDKVPALGYILGDEGSGAYIGKCFVNALLKRQLPTKLANKICKENNINTASIIENVYKNSFPNRYLASLTKIVINHLDHIEIKALVVDSFKEFITKNILHYEGHKDLPIGFVGSVGYHFSNILAEVMTDFQLNLGPIKQAPINELTNYHKRKKC